MDSKWTFLLLLVVSFELASCNGKYFPVDPVSLMFGAINDAANDNDKYNQGGRENNIESCKFPDYAQGSFIDLHVNGGKLRYTINEQEIKNYDGKNAEENESIFSGIKRHVKIIQRNERHEQGKLRGIYNGRERRSLPDDEFDLDNSTFYKHAQPILNHFIFTRLKEVQSKIDGAKKTWNYLFPSKRLPLLFNKTLTNELNKSTYLPPILENFVPYHKAKEVFHDVKTEIESMQEAWNYILHREQRSASVKPEKNPDIGPIKNVSSFRINDDRNKDDAFIELYLQQHCYNKTLYNEPQNLTCWYCNTQSIEKEKEIASCLNLMHKQRVRRFSFPEMFSYPKEELRNDSSIQIRIKQLDDIHQKMTVVTAYMHMLLHTQFLHKSLDDENANVNITEEESDKSRERRSTEVFWPHFVMFGFSPNKTEEEMKNNTQSISPELEDEKEDQHKFYDQICQRIVVAEAYIKMFSEIALDISFNNNNTNADITEDEIKLEQGINYLKQLWVRMSHQKRPTCYKFPFIPRNYENMKEGSVLRKKRCFKTKYEASNEDDRPRRNQTSQRERRSIKYGNLEKSTANFNDKKANFKLVKKNTFLNFEEYDAWENNHEYQSNYLWTNPEQIRNIIQEIKNGKNRQRRATNKKRYQATRSAIENDGVFSGLNNRKRRSPLQIYEKPKNIIEFMWRCTMPVEDTQIQYVNQERGKKFLVWGGKLNNVITGNSTSDTKTGSNITDDDEELNDRMSYACLRLIPRGPNTLGHSIIDMGYPKKDQDIREFARELCLEPRVSPRDIYARRKQNTDPRLQGWNTESQFNQWFNQSK